jgi:hypothetical protein
MTFNSNPQQALYLWSLLTAGGEGFLKDQTYQPEASDRKALVHAGHLEEEKRRHPASGRPAIFNSLTEYGWRWAEENLDAPLAKSAKGALVLQALLRRISAFLDSSKLSLAELLVPALGSPEPSARDLAARIREAYIRLAQGRWNTRVRLADLRQELSDVDRNTLDGELLGLQDRHAVVLYPLDDPQEIGSADREAAIDVGGVGKRHIVYMKG